MGDGFPKVAAIKYKLVYEKPAHSKANSADAKTTRLVSRCHYFRKAKPTPSGVLLKRKPVCLKFKHHLGGTHALHLVFPVDPFAGGADHASSLSTPGKQSPFDLSFINGIGLIRRHICRREPR
jgi:hypothetical protein